jgi:hypothetical protein
VTSAVRVALIAAVAASSIAGGVSAHHSYAAFDACKRVALEGEISKVDW